MDASVWAEASESGIGGNNEIIYKNKHMHELRNIYTYGKYIYMIYVSLCWKLDICVSCLEQEIFSPNCSGVGRVSGPLSKGASTSVGGAGAFWDWTSSDFACMHCLRFNMQI